MALEEITGRLASSTTRRTVVKTGVKIAYAAPIVAASFKLSGRNAFAVSLADECPTSVICGSVSGAGCPGGCNCTRATEGNRFCYLIVGTCPTQPCASSATCPSGTLCQAAGTGCCGQVCYPTCASGAVTEEVGTDPNAG